MATKIDNSFTTWLLSPREEAEGKQLNMYQRQVIQNRLAREAEEKLAWTFDPNNVTICIQREAELQGRVRMLQLMLDEAEEAEEILRTLARES